jgi:hypothetical protein
VLTTNAAVKSYEKYAWVLLIIPELTIVFFSLVGIAFPGLEYLGTSSNEAQQFAGIGFLGVGIFSIGITLKPYRMWERWAWYVSCYPPIITVAAIALVGAPVPEYGPLLVLSLLGLVLPARRFFAKGK